MRTPKRKTFRVPIPKCRDPFVNATLTSLGVGGDGQERFWTSTNNAIEGAMGVVVDEWGGYRIHQFRPGGGLAHMRYYSVAQENADTFWLCDRIDTFVRLCLSDGKYTCHSTGGPAGTCFHGMPFDAATGKLFVIGGGGHPHGISFDTRALKLAAVHDLAGWDLYTSSWFANGDGTYTVISRCPGLSMVRWDPRRETVRRTVLDERIDMHARTGLPLRTIRDDRGRPYLSRYGWYNAARGRFLKTGPRPEQEMTWFGRDGSHAYGAVESGENAMIHEWDMTTGRVRHVRDFPDCQMHQMALSRSGKLICVTQNGVFYRCDAATGAIECTLQLPNMAIGPVDCLVRVDEDHVVGTPFITQRFWQANIRTGEGRDCGRAAPGFGEIMQTVRVGRKTYMAAYTGAELMAYDPARPARYPENPRVAAWPPHAMRPVAIAAGGGSVFYSCSSVYGTLGSTLAGYDTQTGRSRHAVNPIPDQMIRSLHYEPSSRSLLAGTTYDADCGSCRPTTDLCHFARIDAETLACTDRRPAPHGASTARVVGPMGRGRWGCVCEMRGEPRYVWLVIDRDLKPVGEAPVPLPAGNRQIARAGKVGMFVLANEDRIELWDMRKEKRISVLCRQGGVRRLFVQDRSVYLALAREIVVLENCL